MVINISMWSLSYSAHTHLLHTRKRVASWLIPRSVHHVFEGLFLSLLYSLLFLSWVCVFQSFANFHLLFYIISKERKLRVNVLWFAKCWMSWAVIKWSARVCPTNEMMPSARAHQAGCIVYLCISPLPACEHVPKIKSFRLLDTERVIVTAYCCVYYAFTVCFASRHIVSPSGKDDPGNNPTNKVSRTGTMREEERKSRKVICWCWGASLAE